MTDIILTRTVKSRKSHAAKTGMDTRAAKTLAGAMFGKGPAFHEDEDGNMIREWKSSESSSYSNDDLRQAISNRVAVEHNEMLGTIPPSAVKYLVTKGWLKPHGTAGLYFVTAKAARELDLPVRFKGGENHGRRIKFAA